MSTTNITPTLHDLVNIHTAIEYGLTTARKAWIRAIQLSTGVELSKKQTNHLEDDDLLDLATYLAGKRFTPTSVWAFCIVHKDGDIPDPIKDHYMELVKRSAATIDWIDDIVVNCDVDMFSILLPLIPDDADDYDEIIYSMLRMVLDGYKHSEPVKHIDIDTLNVILTYARDKDPIVRAIGELTSSTDTNLMEAITILVTELIRHNKASDIQY